MAASLPGVAALLRELWRPAPNLRVQFEWEGVGVIAGCLPKPGCYLGNETGSECLWFSLWVKELAACDLCHFHGLLGAVSVADGGP